VSAAVPGPHESVADKTVPNIRRRRSGSTFEEYAEMSRARLASFRSYSTDLPISMAPDVAIPMSADLAVPSSPGHGASRRASRPAVDGGLDAATPFGWSPVDGASVWGLSLPPREPGLLGFPPLYSVLDHLSQIDSLSFFDVFISSGEVLYLAYSPLPCQALGAHQPRAG
jgi:hypothetical protein